MIFNVQSHFLCDLYDLLISVIAFGNVMTCILVDWCLFYGDTCFLHVLARRMTLFYPEHGGSSEIKLSL
jgi:hypothetical protein